LTDFPDAWYKYYTTEGEGNTLVLNFPQSVLKIGQMHTPVRWE